MDLDAVFAEINTAGLAPAETPTDASGNKARDSLAHDLARFRFVTESYVSGKLTAIPTSSRNPHRPALPLASSVTVLDSGLSSGGPSASSALFIGSLACLMEPAPTGHPQYLFARQQQLAWDDWFSPSDGANSLTLPAPPAAPPAALAAPFPSAAAFLAPSAAGPTAASALLECPLSPAPSQLQLDRDQLGRLRTCRERRDVSAALAAAGSSSLQRAVADNAAAPVAGTGVGVAGHGGGGIRGSLPFAPAYVTARKTAVAAAQASSGAAPFAGDPGSLFASSAAADSPAATGAGGGAGAAAGEGFGAALGMREGARFPPFGPAELTPFERQTMLRHSSAAGAAAAAAAGAPLAPNLWPELASSAPARAAHLPVDPHSRRLATAAVDVTASADARGDVDAIFSELYVIPPMMPRGLALLPGAAVLPPAGEPAPAATAAAAGAAAAAAQLEALTAAGMRARAAGSVPEAAAAAVAASALMPADTATAGAVAGGRAALGTGGSLAQLLLSVPTLFGADADAEAEAEVAASVTAVPAAAAADDSGRGDDGDVSDDGIAALNVPGGSPRSSARTNGGVLGLSPFPADAPTVVAPAATAGRGAGGYGDAQVQYLDDDDDDDFRASASTAAVSAATAAATAAGVSPGVDAGAGGGGGDIPSQHDGGDSNHDVDDDDDLSDDAGRGAPRVRYDTLGASHSTYTAAAAAAQDAAKAETARAAAATRELAAALAPRPFMPPGGGPGFLDSDEDDGSSSGAGDAGGRGIGSDGGDDDGARPGGVPGGPPALTSALPSPVESMAAVAAAAAAATAAAAAAPAGPRVSSTAFLQSVSSACAAFDALFERAGPSLPFPGAQSRSASAAAVASVSMSAPGALPQDAVEGSGDAVAAATAVPAAPLRSPQSLALAPAQLTRRAPRGERVSGAVTARVDVSSFSDLVPDMAIKYPFELDVFQKEAVVHLERGENVFVAAHTSAGKTVVAEYAVALSRRHSTRVIYTAPIKTLSNQKYRDFRTVFGPANVGLVTGDVALNQDAHCLIMTTEILRSMLYRGADLIRELEFVIFDEVHYLSDPERGVVWEETLIMLPAHVKVVLLSATVPNAAEVADWIGRMRGAPVHVIYTAKRPVPLQFFLWYRGDMMLVVDEKGEFNAAGYTALSKAANVDRAVANNGGGGRGGRGGGSAGGRGGHGGSGGGGSGSGGGGGGGGGAMQRRGGPPQHDWRALLTFANKHGLLPTVVFEFSRTGCERAAAALGGVDLCTASEKAAIQVFIEHALQRLQPADRALPQVQRVRALCLRGIGIHHSGILPIIKEVVEIVFSRGLVKVLFATETFAMGVNTPTKLVIFSGLTKHDGVSRRLLHGSEFIQMAGRAGRRGRDRVGLVAIMSEHTLPPSSTLRGLILGTPLRLTSQFRLTPAMILNVLRQEDCDVEEFITKSFGGAALAAKADAATQQLLRQADRRVAALRRVPITPPLGVTAADVRTHYARVRDYTAAVAHLTTAALKLPAQRRAVFPPGRVLVLNHALAPSAAGVVIAASEASLTVLVLLPPLASSVFPPPGADDSDDDHVDADYRKARPASAPDAAAASAPELGMLSKARFGEWTGAPGGRLAPMTDIEELPAVGDTDAAVDANAGGAGGGGGAGGVSSAAARARLLRSCETDSELSSALADYLYGEREYLLVSIEPQAVGAVLDIALPLATADVTAAAAAAAATRATTRAASSAAAAATTTTAAAAAAHRVARSLRDTEASLLERTLETPRLHQLVELAADGAAPGAPAPVSLVTDGSAAADARRHKFVARPVVRASAVLARLAGLSLVAAAPASPEKEPLALQPQAPHASARAAMAAAAAGGAVAAARHPLSLTAQICLNPWACPLRDPVDLHRLRVQDNSASSSLLDALSLARATAPLLREAGLSGLTATLTACAPLAEIAALEAKTEAARRGLASSGDAALRADYRARCELLLRLGYVDDRLNVLAKGSVACEISTCDAVLLTEVLMENVFNGATPEEAAALVSVFVCQDSVKERPGAAQSNASLARKLKGRALAARGVQAQLAVQESLASEVAAGVARTAGGVHVVSSLNGGGDDDGYDAGDYDYGEESGLVGLPRASIHGGGGGSGDFDDIDADTGAGVSEMTRAAKTLGLPENLTRLLLAVEKIALGVGQAQYEAGVPVAPEQYLADNVRPALALTVYEWARGLPFVRICELTHSQEGSVVRCMLRVAETCRAISSAARVLGNLPLGLLMNRAIELVRRDIAFAASLYLV
jgi:superfamily II RNA helicase